jgi:hypothetical protein
MKQRQLEFGTEKKVLPPIVLPDTHLDLVEQFSLALQNRDAIGLRQLIDKKWKHAIMGDREGFISKFIGYCDRMDKKYNGIYVHTVPGTCGRSNCGRGRGLGVTVNSIADNKHLWRFNLVVGETQKDTVQLWLCKEFKVSSEEIPF